MKKKKKTKTKKEAIYSELAGAKSQPPSLGFGRNSRAGRGVGKIYNEKKKDVWYALIGDGWHGEAGGRLTRSGASSMILWGIYLAFSSWSQVGSRHKKKLVVSYQSLLSLGLMLQDLVFGFLSRFL